MNHKHIEAFRAVMLTGTVTGASRFLNVSQPSVSRLMLDMEAFLHIKLFERRRGGRVTPTPEALRLMTEVERSFVSLDRIVRYAAEIGTFRHGQLTVAGMPALCLDVLPVVMHKWLSSYPEASAVLHAYSSQTIVEAVASQNYEIAFAEPPFDIQGIAGEMIINAPFVCAIPKKHRLARKKTITAEDLNGEPRVILTNSRTLRDGDLRTSQLFGFSRDTRAETTLSIVACRHVELGVGCAIVDPFTARYFRGENIVFRAFQPQISYIVGVLTPEGRSRSAMQRRFLELFKETLAGMTLPAGAKISLEPFNRQPLIAK